MKVLIADDSKSYRLMLGRLISGWGYEISEAVDGEDALDKITEEKDIEMILLDWVMPKMDGIALCKVIKNHPRLKYLHTIMLTGNNAGGQVVVGLDAGADDYIAKPFDKDELKARIGVGRRMVELRRELSGKVDEL